MFAVLAISPPVRPVADPGYRLESLGDPSPGRPWLLRARALAGERMASPPRLSAPEVVVAPVNALRDRGAWYRLMVSRDARAVAISLVDATGTHRVRAATRPLRAPATSAPPTDRLHVVEGTLVPELTGDVIVDPGSGSARLVPVTDEVSVEPATGIADACGLVRFSVRVVGLGAPISLVVARPAGDERHELRLPLVPGGIAVRDEGGAVVLRATSAGAIGHVVAGDASGPTWWSAAALSDEAGEGRATVALPPGVDWVIASHDHDLSEPVSPLVRPSRAPCVATPLGQRLSRGRLSPPPLPPLRVLWDGPAEARALTERRMRSARALCALGLAVSVALEAALLVGAGLARGPSSLLPLEVARRDRLGALATGVSLLLLAGAAMGLSALLRGP